MHSTTMRNEHAVGENVYVTEGPHKGKTATVVVATNERGMCSIEVATYPWRMGEYGKKERVRVMATVRIHASKIVY